MVHEVIQSLYLQATYSPSLRGDAVRAFKRLEYLEVFYVYLESMAWGWFAEGSLELAKA